DQAECAAGGHREVHAVDGPDRGTAGGAEQLGPDREVLGQPFHPQQRFPRGPALGDRGTGRRVLDLGHANSSLTTATPVSAISFTYVSLRNWSGRWQATRWPCSRSTGRISGTSRSHGPPSSIAYRQRGWKAHPGGRLIRLGGL